VDFIERTLPELLERGSLPPVSSVGSVTVRVPGVGEWSLRIDEGRLVVTRALEDDVIVQLTIPADDFCPLIVQGVQRASDPVKAGRAFLKALSLDAETARLIRHVPGSILLEARDGPHVRKLLFTPGRRAANLDAADCTISCALSDLEAVQAGRARGMDLFTSGKLTLRGNVQLALALSGLFL
jgi:hypothetical protein